MTFFKQTLVTGIALLALTACQSEQVGSLYHGFTHIDPISEKTTPNSWVVIENGAIKKLGSGAQPAGKYREYFDMDGLYALPGLIDAHAHITAGPHAVEIKDGAPALTIESQDEITRFNARAALAFGITTVRNPGGSTEANHKYDLNIKDGIWIGPEALHAGSILQPPPMGGSAFTYPKSKAEWDAEAQYQADKGMEYFKLYVSLTEDEVAQGIRAAHKAGLKATAHLDSVSWQKAAELGIDGLEHSLPTSADLLPENVRQTYLDERGPDSRYMYRWFELVDFESSEFQSLKQTLVDNQVELNFNFLVNYLVCFGDNPNLISSDWDPYVHPESLAASKAMMTMSLTGWTEQDFENACAIFPKVLEFGKILHDAGLPIMIGTDGYGGTPYYAMEMGFHVDAGIPKWDVLRMATHSAAEILGISDRTGRIKPGLEADIVFLRANPLDDMSNIAEVELTLTNGKPLKFKDLIVAE